MQANNIFSNIPEQLREELFEVVLETAQLKVERIVSRGHSSPRGEWYDQDQNEWVILLKGSACLKYSNGKTIDMKPGDYVNIPAHVKHRVERTSAEEDTVWLAVFYG